VFRIIANNQNVHVTYDCLHVIGKGKRHQFISRDYTANTLMRETVVFNFVLCFVVDWSRRCV